MTEDLPHTWADRELPILRAALRHVDAGEQFINLKVIRAEAGITAAQMRAGLKALRDASPPYITVITIKGDPDEVEGHVESVSERTRRELGTWPSAENMVDRLAAALEEAADQEDEPERKSKLKAAREVLIGMAREVAVAVISKQVGG